MASANPSSGLRQIAQILSVESLVRIGDDGRLQPGLAGGWELSGDRRTASLRLRPDVKFHDGSPASANTVKEIVSRTMARWMGPVVSDVDGVTVRGDSQLEFQFRYPSPMLLESLEIPIQKPSRDATIGTGAFKMVGSRFVANPDYYLGRPTIREISVTPFPSVRAAWAEMLRGHIDMLWEVGTDAFDSLERSNNIAVFKFTRRYQYEVVFGKRNPALAPVEVRRAISGAVDRDEIIREALDGHGIASTGPVWPQHWALGTAAARPLFTPSQLAGRNLRVRFTCLVPPDYARIALVVKQQLAAVGVDVQLEESGPDELIKAMSSGDFDAALVDLISGASVFRVYQLWHTRGSLNPGGTLGKALYDAALDSIRHANSETEYRAAIAHLQQLFIDDPPAIFLAWSERARAVSTRFQVPELAPGRDVIATLRLWRPTDAVAAANRN